MQSNEKKILNIIRYFPSLFVILISAILTYYLYNQSQQNLKIETQKLESNYIELNKEQIKYHVIRTKEQILNEKSLQLENLKKELKEQVYNGYKILEKVYEENKNESKEIIFKKVKNLLENISFNDDRSYIFIYTLDGTNILHPKKRYLENKNFWKAQDDKGTFFIQEMNKILSEKDETFYSWYWKKDDKSKLSHEKIGFFKKFEPLGIFIGIGEYIKDAQESLKNKLLKNISNFIYHKNGYIFVINFDGTYLGYYDESFIGKSVYEKSFNPDIQNTFRTMIKASLKGDFISYYHSSKPDKTTAQNVYKYSYVDSIKEWDWIIGTGFYMDDFYIDLEKKKKYLINSTNKSIQRVLLVSFVITLFILVIFLNLSNFLESKFKEYQEDIKQQINDNIKKDNILAHQSKMAAMGEMIGNIAHQWRQPLSTISTVVTGIKMKKELGIEDDKSEIESLDMVNKHVQYLSHTIDDFRDFFKPQKEARRFNISSAINRAIGLVTIQFKSKNINIIKNIEEVELNSLQNELIQVLINILNNARDELVKIDEDRFIFVDVKKVEDNVTIVIKDNAGGIPQEILNQIFKAYFTTKADFEGTGIGLFMTEEIITKHLKGNVLVSNDTYKYGSLEFKGAIFKIILPINIKK